jgi:hypothetical protein
MNLYIKISYMSYYDNFASQFDYKKKRQTKKWKKTK